MATYDPKRARMRGREETAAGTAPADEAAPAPVDLLLDGAPEVVVHEPVVAADEPVVVAVEEPVVVAAEPVEAEEPVVAAADEHDGHEHGPDCDHDHGGIDVRVLAAAGVAAALTVMGIVRARRRRSA